MSKYILSICAVLMLIVAGAALAARADRAAAPVVVMAGSEKWSPGTSPLPPTVGVAVLDGNPKQAGSVYVIRLKMPDGTLFKPHWHSEVEQVTVIKGTLMVGIGTTVDRSKMIALPTGSFGSIPTGLRHYAMAKGDTIIEIHSLGPRTMQYVQPGM